MKSRLFILILILIFSFIQLFPQSAAEIIEKNIKARGGKGKISSVNSLSVEGTVTISGKCEPFRLYYKEPDKYRIEFTANANEIIIVINGQEGWLLNPAMKDDTMTSLSAESIADYIDKSDFLRGPLFNYKEKNYTVELLGVEKSDNKDSYKLQITIGNTVQLFYIDAENFLINENIRKEVILMDEKKDIETKYLKYKKFNGLNLPVSFSTCSSGEQVGDMEFDKVSINPAINDSMFVKPVVESKAH